MPKTSGAGKLKKYRGMSEGGVRSRREEKKGPQSVTLYRDAQHGASVDLGLQTEIMIMPVKTRARERERGEGKGVAGVMKPKRKKIY